MVKKRFFLYFIMTLFFVTAGLLIVSPVLLTVFQSAQDHFIGYIDFFIWKPKYLNALCRSLLSASISSCSTIFFGVFAGYVFAKVPFRGKKILFFLVIMVMIMPFQVTLLPHYLVSTTLGTYDSLLALILPNIFAPTAVFLLTQMIKVIPNELIEAGRLETSSTILIILKIILPSVKTGIVCTFILVFSDVWNQVAEPRILLESAAKMTLAPILNALTQLDPVSYAAAVYFILAPLLFYLLYSEQIVSELSLVSNGIKN